MQLTRFTDYSIRALSLVACQKPEGLTTITEIAETYNLSRNHVVKVVHRLGQLGYLHTQRGKRGGVRLALPADQIPIGQLVQMMEPRHSLVPCNTPTCQLQNSCRLGKIMGQAMKQFYAELDRYTLADIMGTPETITNLIEMFDE
jgi:Rrf2 family nitric oxide-sensitive transcriptional repressor